MSETMRSNDFAQNSITGSRSAFPFRDNVAIDAYHSRNRYSYTDQVSEDHLNINQQNLQPSYDAFQPTSFIQGSERPHHPYQLPQSYGFQELAQQDYGLHYGPPESFPVSHIANPVADHFRQDGMCWNINLQHEVNQGQHGVDDDEVTMSVPTGSQTTTAETDPIYKNEPYAKLIFVALRSAPGHRMVLKDIYKWFERFTDKAQPGTKGWQNSIRHNLSMNVAFLKEETGDDLSDDKRSYVWALSKEALEKGSVESTTRFRKHPKKTHVARPSYRVSKTYSTNAQRTMPSPRYLLPPYDQPWAYGTARTQQKQDMEEIRALQPRNSVWTREIPQASAQTVSLSQPYQFFPNEMLPPVRSVDDYGLDARNISYQFGQEATRAYQQHPRYEYNGIRHEEIGSPWESTPAKENSPTPSMTATHSSLGYHEVADEERNNFVHSPDLHSNVLQSGEQTHLGTRLSSANPYYANY